jgi:hypothetical protein
MTEGQFLSRREMREAQQQPAQSVPAAEVIASAEPVEPVVSQFNFPPLTKSQLVQVGRLESEEDETRVSTAVNNVQTSSISVPQIATTGVVNPYAPKVSAIPASAAATDAPAAPVTAVAPAAPLQQVERAYEPVLGEAEEPITASMQLFDVSPNLNIEPQTASIIIDNFEPLDAISIAISETGELLKTGSIELPNLSTNTGEIATLLDASVVDDAIAKDSINGYVSTIAPLRASGVVNTAGKIGIMPTKNAKGQSAGFAVLTLSLLMIAVGGLVLAAFMLGFLK